MPVNVKIILVLIATLGACGTNSHKKKDATTANPPAEQKPGEQKPADENANPSDEKNPEHTPANDKFAAMTFTNDLGNDQIILTQSMTQWKLNRLAWESAKSQTKAQSVTPIETISLRNEQSPKEYTFGYSYIGKSNCESRDEPVVKMTLQTIEQGKITATQVMELNHPIAVDPQHNTYQLEVTVENPGKCEAINLTMGFMAG